MMKPGVESEDRTKSASALTFQLAMRFSAVLLMVQAMAPLVMKSGPQNLVLQILKETWE
jgi:hypothetical protein